MCAADTGRESGKEEVAKRSCNQWERRPHSHRVPRDPARWDNHLMVTCLEIGEEKRWREPYARKADDFCSNRSQSTRRVFIRECEKEGKGEKKGSRHVRRVPSKRAREILKERSTRIAGRKAREHEKHPKPLYPLSPTETEKGT